MRLEDYGKKMINQLPATSKDDAIKSLQEIFVNNMGTKYYLLLSKEVDYYTVFKIESSQPALELYEYFLNSSFQNKDGTLVPMTNIQYIEHREDRATEIWIGGTYFHFTPFDWGVEKL